jgi:hypothetical protein
MCMYLCVYLFNMYSCMYIFEYIYVIHHRGAVLATELKNNSCKLAKWTAQSILAGADQMKLGMYVCLYVWVCMYIYFVLPQRLYTYMCIYVYTYM